MPAPPPLPSAQTLQQIQRIRVAVRVWVVATGAAAAAGSTNSSRCATSGWTMRRKSPSRVQALFSFTASADSSTRALSFSKDTELDVVEVRDVGGVTACLALLPESGRQGWVPMAFVHVKEYRTEEEPQEEQHLRGMMSGLVVSVWPLRPEAAQVVVAFQAGLVWLYDAADFRIVQRRELSTASGAGAFECNQMAVNSSADLAALGCADNAVRLVRLSDFAVVAVLQGHTKPVHAVCFGPHGAALLSGDAGGSVLLWDITTRAVRLRLNPHWSAVTSLAVSTDGRLAVSAADDRTLCLWHLPSWAWSGSPLGAEDKVSVGGAGSDSSSSNSSRNSGSNSSSNSSNSSGTGAQGAVGWDGLQRECVALATLCLCVLLGRNGTLERPSARQDPDLRPLRSLHRALRVYHTNLVVDCLHHAVDETVFLGLSWPVWMPLSALANLAQLPLHAKHMADRTTLALICRLVVHADVRVQEAACRALANLACWLDLRLLLPQLPGVLRSVQDPAANQNVQLRRLAARITQNLQLTQASMSLPAPLAAVSAIVTHALPITLHGVPALAQLLWSVAARHRA
eukprot:m.257759 g.257759  ORF g.257759 m.257759 type:complete len:571 (-) comp22711_c1_seq6:33-1745(-)